MCLNNDADVTLCTLLVNNHNTIVSITATVKLSTKWRGQMPSYNILTNLK